MFDKKGYFEITKTGKIDYKAKWVYIWVKLVRSNRHISGSITPLKRFSSQEEHIIIKVVSIHKKKDFF